MNTAVLTRKVTHPVRWIALFLLAITILIVFHALLRRDYFWNARPTSLEKVLWTSDPDYQSFYGPGTPQSSKLAKRLFDENYLGKDFRVPNVPIYIYPPVISVASQPDDPAIIYNFNLDMAERLRASHTKKP